jgi:uncharacterized protein involved in response to NO
LLTAGFRPFFLAAAVWSAAALGLWIAALAGGATLPSRFDPLAWHIHEVIFGFALAAVAGFLLTAVPNWTGRLPVPGLPLAGLAGLWLLGRGASLFSALLPVEIAIAADLAFPATLAAVIAREIVAGRNRRNLMMTTPLLVLAIADLLMQLEAAGVRAPKGLGWRLGLAALGVLVSVVGGRIIPSFTRNWLAKRGPAPVSAAPGRIDRAALGFLHSGLVGWALFPDFVPIGWLLLLGAAFNLIRLMRWHGLATLAEPLLFVLHLGYAWLVVGAALLGAAVLRTGVVPSAAIHALTAGAIGTMTLAVMTRASLGHTGRELKANRVTVAIYVSASLAAVARVAAVLGGRWTMLLLDGSAALWIAAFALFALHYGPMLLRPRVAGLQLPQELDHRGADLGRPLLLGPVAAAGQNDRPAQLRHEIREIGEEPVHAGEGEDRVALAGDEKRRHDHGEPGERRQQLPVAIDVAIPVEPAAKPGAGEFAGIEFEIRLG